MQFKTTGKPGQQVPPAQTAQERKKAGLDAVLQSLQKVKKVNVLDKSRMDWGDFKSTDTQVSCQAARKGCLRLLTPCNVLAVCTDCLLPAGAQGPSRSSDTRKPCAYM